MRQAKERLIKGQKDSQRLVSNFAINFQKLVSLAHSNVPVRDKEQIPIAYPIRSVESHAIPWHLPSVDTSTFEWTVKAIDEYLAIGTSDQLICKAVCEDTGSSQLTTLEITVVGQ